MSEHLKIEIAAISIIHIVAIVLSIVFFMIFYLKAQKNYALYVFLIMQISMIGWMIFKIFKTVSPTEMTRWWFIVGYYFFVCVFEIAFLEFMFSVYHGRAIKRSIRFMMYVIAGVQFVWVLTNPYHHLFYATYNFWRDQFGILFYIHLVIEYGFIFIGIYYGYKIFTRQLMHKKIWVKLLIASAILFPLILNMLFVTKQLHHWIHSMGIPIVFDVTPIVFVFSITVFVYATFMHDFISLSPIMRHEIVHKLDTPIGVLDSSFDVIYCNEKMYQMFGADAQRILLKSLKDLPENYEGEALIGDHYVKLFLKEVYMLKETQYLVTLRNISHYKQMEQQMTEEQQLLEEKKQILEQTIESLKQISKAGARQYVTRELHDIVGHSLVVTIKLLDVAKLYVHRDTEKSAQAIKDAQSALKDGILSMNRIQMKEEEYTGMRLRKDLERILHRIQLVDVKAKLNIRGGDQMIEEKTYDAVTRVCLELLTNSIKHAEAKELFLSINVRADGLNIFYIDNGKGCDDLIIGNGLEGIQSRVSMLGGDCQYITSEGEGFIAKISI